MEFKNMKFAVKDAAQSAALQKMLFGLGYDWEFPSYKGAVQPSQTGELLASSAGILYTGVWKDDGYETVDTAAFLAEHTKPATKPAKTPFVGLEEAYSNPSEPLSPWFDNHGEQPVADDVLVDLEFRGVAVIGLVRAGDLRWKFQGDNGGWDIVKWRYSRNEDYFKSPVTSLKVGSFSSLGGGPARITSGTIDVGDGKGAWKGEWKVDADGAVKPAPSAAEERLLKAIFGEDKPTATIDSHYAFTYTLTEADKSTGTIKVDPYFVAQQWKLGSKDESGAIWHIFKTCCRFGEKNDKAREITAIYKTIKRLAEIEGVTLK